ncbi:MAG: type III pantothenate kinase [Gemmataceae bacterium]
MKPAVVVDVGNTRIKWGRVVGQTVQDRVSLPPDDPSAWSEQILQWRLSPSVHWILSGVQPKWCDALARWLREKGHTVGQINDWQQLPVKVALDQPQFVGIDRLFNAVAANACRKSGRPAVLIDAGSAVTVDQVNENGAFAGGAILPGFHLMGQALHTYTAKLPLVSMPQRFDELPFAPGKNTADAMRLGVFWSVMGAIVFLIAEMRQTSPEKAFPQIFLTGGDAQILEPELSRQLADPAFPYCSVPAGETIHLWPTMTLEGIRLTAEALP